MVYFEFICFQSLLEFNVLSVKFNNMILFLQWPALNCNLNEMKILSASTSGGAACH